MATPPADTGASPGASGNTSPTGRVLRLGERAGGGYGVGSPLPQGRGAGGEGDGEREVVDPPSPSPLSPRRGEADHFTPSDFSLFFAFAAAFVFPLALINCFSTPTPNSFSWPVCSAKWNPR